MSWDGLSVDKSESSMEPIDNLSETSVNTFKDNSDSEHTPTQSKIDVEDWGNSLPFIQDPGYTICIFQNIRPQPKGGFDAKAHHNKNAFKALGPEVVLFAEHGLNKTKIHPGHTFYKCQHDSIDGTYSYLVNLKLPSGSPQKSPILLQIMEDYNHLHCIIDTIYMEEAPEIHISYAGGDPWSLAFKKVCKCVSYWYRMWK